MTGGLTAVKARVYTICMKSTHKKLATVLIVVFSVVILGLTALPALGVESIQFDPQGTIKNELQLPDKSPVDITIRVVQWVLGMLGLIAVILILVGGFTWMTSAGNEEKIKKAKAILTSAIIGLMIILLSWALVTFVIARVNNVTT